MHPGDKVTALPAAQPPAESATDLAARLVMLLSLMAQKKLKGDARGELRAAKLLAAELKRADPNNAHLSSLQRRLRQWEGALDSSNTNHTG